MRPPVALMLTCGALLLAALLPAAAQAASTPRFGIGDQHAAMFTDPRWEGMDLRITRYNVPWNAAEDPATLARAVTFVDAANAAGVEVLLHVTGQLVDGAREPLPTRAQYRREIRKLVAIFLPMGVSTWGAWNEANHSSQPTFDHPERAAEYFLELRTACPGCTVVALDELTQGSPRSKGVASYRGFARRFFTALGSRRSLVKIVGFHNYGELILDKGPGNSKDFARYVRGFVPKARFWITESGGIAANRSRLCSESRQVTGTRRMFIQAKALVPYGIDRLYLYNWTGGDCDERFDSGMIRPDGTARPALAVVRRNAAAFRR